MTLGLKERFGINKLGFSARFEAALSQRSQTANLKLLTLTLEHFHADSSELKFALCRLKVALRISLGGFGDCKRLFHLCNS